MTRYTEQTGKVYGFVVLEEFPEDRYKEQTEDAVDDNYNTQRLDVPVEAALHDDGKDHTCAVRRIHADESGQEDEHRTCKKELYKGKSQNRYCVNHPSNAKFEHLRFELFVNR